MGLADHTPERRAPGVTDVVDGLEGEDRETFVAWAVDPMITTAQIANILEAEYPGVKVSIRQLDVIRKRLGRPDTVFHKSR